jgi:hypothetical protein
MSHLIGISIPFTHDIHIFPSIRNGSFNVKFFSPPGETPTPLGLCAKVAAMCMQAFCLVRRRLEVAAEQAAARMLNSIYCD